MFYQSRAKDHKLTVSKWAIIVTTNIYINFLFPNTPLKATLFLAFDAQTKALLIIRFSL